MSLPGHLDGSIVDILVQILLGDCPVHVGCVLESQASTY